jgi:pantetheine-phosphate adenylyltransferase
MKELAIYAGTFDPITVGHIDIIERAAKLFDQVVVGVAIAAHKKTLFSLEERITMNQTALAHLPNVSVQGFNQLAVHFAKDLGAHVFIRSLRNVTDFDYEFQLANMNRALSPNIETVFLMSAEKYMSLSSSLIREIAAFKGDITAFVPPHVFSAMMEKIK